MSGLVGDVDAFERVSAVPGVSNEQACAIAGIQAQARVLFILSRKVDEEAIVAM